MSNTKLQLNPNLTISHFDGNYGNELLYEVIDSQGHYKRFTITQTVHKILLTFGEKKSLDAGLAMQNGNLNDDEITAFKNLVENYFLPNNVLLKEGDSAPPTTQIRPKKPSYMLLKFTLLNPQMVRRVATPFLPLFSLHWHLIFLLLFFITQTLFYFPEFISDIGIPVFDPTTTISSPDILSTLFFAFLGLLFHEIGHATAAIKYKCKEVDIGMGLYICFIVFYADLSEIWRLNRRQRLLVDVGGMYFQLIFMVIISFAYFFTANQALYFANIILAISFLWNLNPFFRLDGYWIASDLFGFDNLRAAAHASGVRNGKAHPERRQLKSHRKQSGNKKKALLVYSLLSKVAFIGLIYWFSFYVFIDILTELPNKIQAFGASTSISDFLVTSGGLIWTALMLYFVAYLAIRVVKLVYSTACKTGSYFWGALRRRNH